MVQFLRILSVLSVGEVVGLLCDDATTTRSYVVQGGTD